MEGELVDNEVFPERVPLLVYTLMIFAVWGDDTETNTVDDARPLAPLPRPREEGELVDTAVVPEGFTPLVDTPTFGITV